MTDIPDFTTPDKLAKSTGWSSRRIRETARALGACHIMGNRMTLTAENVKVILEASRPCPSNCIGAEKSGTTAAPLPEGSYEDLRALRARKLPSVSPPQKNRLNGKVISMDRHRS